MTQLFANLVFVLLFTVTAGALGLPKNQFPKGQKAPDLAPYSRGLTYNFEGIVALNNCSGSLIQFENSRDNDKAVVLTNGHCYEGGFAKAGEYVSNIASNRSFRVLDANAQGLGTVTATKVLYSTMTGTDITLYQLKETFAEIKTKFNVRPLTLVSSHPLVSDAIEVVSGYWKRGFSCNIETFVAQLKEDNWTMKDSIRYSRPGCETFGGTSGSPVILAGTRKVIAINNTGNESGEQCTMNNPCEVDSAGNMTFVKGYSYGQQTYWIYSCLNSANEIDVKQPGCLLTH